MNQQSQGTVDEYERVANTYEQAFGPSMTMTWRYGISTLLRPELLKDAKLIDLCCGTGLGALLLRIGSPQNIIGVDLSPSMLALARGRYDHLVVADMCRMPFAADAFDLLTCGGDSVNHLSNDQLCDFLCAMRRRGVTQRFAFDVILDAALPLLRVVGTVPRGNGATSSFRVDGKILESSHELGLSEPIMFRHHLPSENQLEHALCNAGWAIEDRHPIQIPYQPSLPGHMAYLCVRQS